MAKQRRDKSRGPTFNETIAAGKAAGPRAAEDPASTMNLLPVWCFKRVITADESHRWTSMHDEAERRDVYEALRNYSSMKWREILQKKSCHSAEIDQVAEPVRGVIKRHCPDIESVFQLRVSATGRIWGVTVGPTFQLLLWDPLHEGWPVEKKNT